MRKKLNPCISLLDDETSGYLRHVLWNSLVGEARVGVSPSCQTLYHADFALQFAAAQFTCNVSNRGCGRF